MRDYVTVVTGAPRSGTALMMRMLDAGGIPALTDGHRPPDEHNPGGYFEYDPVKRLAEDASWLEAARGRAVKVIYRLLAHLPNSYQFDPNRPEATSFSDFFVYGRHDAGCVVRLPSPA